MPVWKIQVIFILIILSFELGIVIGYFFRSMEEIERSCKRILKALYPFYKKDV